MIMMEIRFIFRDMRHREFMQGPSLKADYLNNSLKISGENLIRKEDFPPIHIPGLCPIFGNFLQFRWDSVLLWPSIRQDLIDILKTGDSKRKMAVKSGLSWAMVKLMNPKL